MLTPRHSLGQEKLETTLTLRLQLTSGPEKSASWQQDYGQLLLRNDCIKLAGDVAHFGNGHEFTKLCLPACGLATLFPKDLILSFLT